MNNYMDQLGSKMAVHEWFPMYLPLNTMVWVVDVLEMSEYLIETTWPDLEGSEQRPREGV